MAQKYCAEQIEALARTHIYVVKKSPANYYNEPTLKRVASGNGNGTGQMERK